VTIEHADGLAHPPLKIRGTRSSIAPAADAEKLPRRHGQRRRPAGGNARATGDHPVPP
jgi:hypothetical protein